MQIDAILTNPFSMRSQKLEPDCAGFMSNRGRQNVASYLVLDMGVDWRRGADWFESVLQDYDVCSNWGNWVAAAGLTGGRINHFNITKQSKVSAVSQSVIHSFMHACMHSFIHSFITHVFFP